MDDRSESTYKDIINAAPIAMMAVLDTKIVFANQAAATMLGYFGESELTGLSVWDCVHEDCHQLLFERYANIDRNINNEPVEFQLKKPDGSCSYVETTSVPIRWNNQRAALIVGQDISERKQFEDALQVLLRETSFEVGADYIAKLVKLLARTMDCRYAFAGEVDESGLNIHTMSVWANDDYGENFTYCLEGSPCSKVRDSLYFIYPENIQHEFPDNQLLRDLNVQSYSGCPLYDAAGEFIGVIGIMDDKPLPNRPYYQALFQLISTRASSELQRQRSEDALRESEAKYRVIVENTPDIIAHYSRHRKFEYVSKAVVVYTGIRAEKYIGKSVRDMGLPPVYSRFWEKNIQHVLDTGMAHETEFYFRHLNRRLTCNLRLIPRMSGSGDVESIVVIIRDITEHRKVERDYRALFDRMLDGFSVHEMIYDENGEPVDYRFLSVNPAYANLVGKPADHIVGRLASEIFPDLEPFWINAFGQVARTGQATRFEEYAGNMKRYLEVEAFRPHLEQFATITKDVTTQRLSEIALLNSERRYRTLLETASDSIITLSGKGRIIFWNPATEKLFGIEGDGLDEMELTSLLDERSGGFVNMMMARQASVEEQRGGLEIEARACRKNGEMFPIELSMACWSNDKGIFYTIIMRDISDRKRMESERSRLEKQLQHARKMESIGTLAGGIAHDFNNILQPVLGYASMAYSIADKNTRIGKFLGLILQGARRARDLVKLMLDFSRRNQIKAEAVELQVVLDEVLELLHASIPASIKLVKNLSSESLPVMADQTQIHQIMMNLVNNAVQAILPGKGTIQITLTSSGNNPACGCSNSSGKTGDQVVLIVEDDGAGMNEETLERVFDPFFTTKSPGKGTGLGLSVVHGITKSMGGDIVVDSEVGRGTCISICIPRLKDYVINEKAGKPELRQARERVLFVDDNDEAAEVGVEMLQFLGYQTRGMTSSVEALQVFKKSPDSFDLVFVDLQMPELSGVELINRLLSVKPDVPIIAITGSLTEDILPSLHRMGISQCLAKPLSPDEIDSAISKILS